MSQSITSVTEYYECHRVLRVSQSITILLGYCFSSNSVQIPNLVFVILLSIFGLTPAPTDAQISMGE